MKIIAIILGVILALLALGAAAYFLIPYFMPGSSTTPSYTSQVVVTEEQTEETSSGDPEIDFLEQEVNSITDPTGEEITIVDLNGL